jgi:hypothetical protein
MVVHVTRFVVLVGSAPRRRGRRAVGPYEPGGIPLVQAEGHAKRSMMHARGDAK